MNIKNIRIVTLKYTFPAIVMGIKVVMLIVIIFIDSSINLSPVYIITSCKRFKGDTLKYLKALNKIPLKAYMVSLICFKSC